VIGSAPGRVQKQNLPASWPVSPEGELMKTALTAAVLAWAAMAGTAQADFRFPHETDFGLLKPSHKTKEQRQRAVKLYYRQWKKDYLKTPSGFPDFRYVAGPVTGDVPDDWKERDKTVKIMSGSENTGYGMLLTVTMEGQCATDPAAECPGPRSEKADFDGLVKTYLRFRSNMCSGCKLMSWAVPSNFDPTFRSDNAADGDLDIALALLMAHQQWGSNGTVNYLQMAKDEFAAIAKYNFTLHKIPGQADYRIRVNLGDWSLANGGNFVEADQKTDLDGDGAKTKTFKGLYPYATRPSDWMLSHFHVFGRRFGTQCVRDCSTNPLSYGSVGNMAAAEIRDLYNTYFKSGSAGVPAAWNKGLISDFVVPKTLAGGTIGNAPWSKEAVKRAPDRFIGEDFPTSKWSQNAVRVPWRITWDVMASGSDDSKAWARRIANFGIDQAHVPESNLEFNWGPTGRIGSTYDLDGTKVTSWGGRSFPHGQHFASMLITPLVTLKGQPEQAAAQAALNKGWDYMVSARTGPGSNPDGTSENGYFKDSLTLFSMLTVAGLIWFP